jgi:hypothetical protein
MTLRTQSIGSRAVLASRGVLAVAIVAASAGFAGGARADAASVSAFDEHCYAVMPDIAAVEAKAASEKWTALEGKELDAFRPAVEPQVLKAWTLDVAGKEHTVAVTQSAMDDQSKSDFPAFADATNFACSVLLPTDGAPPAEIGAALETLLTRKPDDAYDEGPFKVSAWTATTDKLMVFVYHYSPKTGHPGGLLSMIVFKKA